MPNLAWLYVAAVYGAAVWLARRGGVEVPRRVAVLFYALTLAFLLGPLTRNESNLHLDYLKNLAPWSEVSADQRVLNPELNDVPMQHLPWAHQVRRSWRALSPPLWNPLAGCGTPLLANGQSSALSPIRLAASGLPLVNAMAAEAAFKILVALTFTFLFCRGRGYSPPASVAGAVAFGFSGFVAAWLHFPHVTAACFLPAVLWFADRLLAAPSRGAFLGAVAAWVAIVFAGHPETAAHVFLLALLYLGWAVGVERRAPWRAFLRLGGALTVAALLSAPFLLPFLEALPASQRLESVQAIPYDPDDQPFTDRGSMVAMFQPHFFGRAPAEKTWGPASTETVSGFPGMLGFVGFFAVALRVAVRRAWRSPEAFFVLATLFAYGIIASWPLLGEAVHAVFPVVAHARVRLLFVMLLAILAAAAVDLVRKGDGRFVLGGAAAAAALLVALFATTRFPQPALRQGALVAAIPGAMVLAMAAAYALLPVRALQVLLLAGMAVDLGIVTRGWNPSIPNDLLYPETPLIAKLKELRAGQPPNQPFRIAGMGGMLFPNTGVLHGFEDVRVHDPMANGAYLRFLGLTTGLDPMAYHATMEKPDAAVFDHLNVRYLVAYPGAIAWPDPGRWAGVYDGADGRIFENRRFLPRFYAVRNVVVEPDRYAFPERLRAHQDWGGAALVDADAARALPDELRTPVATGAPVATTAIVAAKPAGYRIRVRAARPSLIVSSLPWYPGWKIERSGRAVRPVRVNAAFIGIPVPAGEWDLRVRYAPWSFRIGCLIALVTLAGLGVWRYRGKSALSSRAANVGRGRD